MHDPATFESRFADAVSRYADLAPVDVEPVSMTLTVTARGSRSALRWASSLGSSRMAMLLLLMLVALAAVGAAVVGVELLRKLVPVNHDIFAPTGLMMEPRIDATATRLPDGRILIAGGWNQLRTRLAGGQNDDGSPALATAEIFDPATETFSTIGSMIQARRDATATLLTDGRVLIAGGFPFAPTADGSENPGEALDSAEVFDPATNTFSSVGAMTSTRGFHSATLLQDGAVLLAGGLGYQGHEPPAGPGAAPLDSVETYDPATQTFRSIGSRMHTGRYRPIATRLLDGRVLIVGDEVSQPLADIFDPRSERFTGVPATNAGASASSASTLPDGLVLLIGEGLRPDGTRTLTPSWQQFDQTTDTFTTIRPGGGFGDIIVPLADGRLLVLGAPPPGVGLPVEPTSQVFDPQTGAVRNVGPMIDLREDGQTATLLSDGRVLVAGGRLGNFQDVGSATNPPYTYVAYQSAELFEP